MGLLASFMSKPALPNVYSSGWHLHQSLFHTATGKNAFAEAGVLLSETGMHFVGGLLEHARASAAFSNPTVNGYKRLNGQSPGAKAGGLVARQQGRDVPAGRRHGRSGDSYRESIRRAGSQSVSLHGLADRRRPGRHGEQDRSGRAPGGPLCAGAETADAGEPGTRRWTRCPRRPCSGRHSGTSSSITTYLSVVTKSDAFRSHVTDWEHREYFEAF